MLAQHVTIDDDLTQQTGLFSDIPIESYHTRPGISSSGISLLLNCPKKYWYRYLQGHTQPKKSEAFRLGTCFHTLILEPDEFDKRYYVVPRQRRDSRSKDWKAVINKAEEREILFEDELEQIEKMQASLFTLDIAQKALKNGQVETSLFWYDDDSEALCKSRPDYFTDSLIIDLKTTDRADPFHFSKSIYNYGYHRQAAMALDGLSTLTRKKYDSVIYLVVEKEPPYLCSAYLLNDTSIQQGRLEYKEALFTYQKCRQDNHWPGYNTTLMDIALPDWAMQHAA